jgi:hypothetical protein
MEKEIRITKSRMIYAPKRNFVILLNIILIRKGFYLNLSIHGGLTGVKQYNTVFLMKITNV